MMVRVLTVLVFVGSILLCEQAALQGIEDANFWRHQGEKHLRKILAMTSKQKNDAIAKNIIFFLGDGMGMTSVTAGRIYKGQKNGQSGEEASLTFDDFPNVGLAKTYNVDKQVPDSAGTATALFSGIKTNYGVIGMDVTTTPTNPDQGKLTSIMDWAVSVGKRTGIVTTTRISHATPASLYSNVYNRDWECDSVVPEVSSGIFKDISRQLIEDYPGKRLNVIMGGGKSVLGALNSKEPKSTLFTGPSEVVCGRSDGRNLTEEWLDISANRSLVLSRDDLLSLNAESVDHLMGIFANNHLTFKVARPKDQPTLSEMVEKALDVLIRKDSKGFVLVVEGGRIDQGHHQNYAKAALEELLEMDEAIALALKRTNPSETLVVVTADHSHAMTLNGYPKRGADILGFGNKNNITPYETLTYANGPGFYDHRLNDSQSKSSGNFGTWVSVQNLSTMARDAPNYRHLATFPLKDETHGGEDVPVYATGPGAELIRGVFEQNYVAYVLSYVGCFGPAMHLNKFCMENPKSNHLFYDIIPSSKSTSLSSSLAAVIFPYLAYYLR